MISRSDVVQTIRDTLGTLVFQTRRGTTSQWAASTRPLKAGEQGWNTTTKQMYVGDGVKLYPNYDVVGVGVVSNPSSGGGFTQSQIQAMIDTSIGNLVIPPAGLTQVQIQDLINTSINNIAFPPGYVLPSSVVQAVTVVTGSEARPNASVVLWVGGYVRPTNMQDQDVHLSVDPPDVTAPSTPINLAASAIHVSGFTVSWSPSTDDTAVTGYEIRLNGGASISKTTNSHAFTGLTEDTNYTVEVRARDEAGNFTPWASLVVKTSAPSALRTFYTDQYLTDMLSESPSLPTVANEAGGIELGAGYMSSIFPSAGLGSSFLVHGLRLYNPSNATPSYLSATVTARLYSRELDTEPYVTGSIGDKSAAVRVATYSEPRLAGTWTQILFDTPLRFNPGQGGVQDPYDDIAFVTVELSSKDYMSIPFGNFPNFMAAHSSSGTGSGPLKSGNGDSLRLTAGGTRAIFRLGNQSYFTEGSNWYGVDLVYELVS